MKLDPERAFINRNSHHGTPSAKASGHMGEKTNERLAFGALHPNIQIQDDKTIGFINPKKASAWAGISNLLMEFQKSYPDCTVDDLSNPSSIIFENSSAKKFAADFQTHMDGKNKTNKQR